MTRERVRAFGSDPISYSSLQPGLSHFETSFGSIAYQSALGFDLTLGPPLCAPADRAQLISRFLSARRRPIFFYVQQDVAQLVVDLAGKRHHASGMGVDKLLPLTDWHQPDPRVASAVKKAKKRGLVLREVQLAKLTGSEAARIKEITDRYLQRSAVSAEMHFLNRPLAFDDDGMARTFVLQEGEGPPFGYAALDPYFESGKPIGYLLNQLRFEPTPLWGVYFSAVSILAAMLRAEGIRELSLGFAPLANADTTRFSAKLGAQVRWMEKRFSTVAYIARLREMKDAFTGSTPQRYFVTPSSGAASTVVAFLRACRVPFWPIIRSRLPWAAK